MKSGLRCRKSFAMTREFFSKQLKVPLPQNSNSTTTTTENMEKAVPAAEVEQPPKKSEVDPRSVCIRTAFRPLGLMAKIFGLFPCYRLSFKIDPNRTRCAKVKTMEFLDYMYTGVILLLFIGGSVLCFIKPPSAIEAMIDDARDGKTDYLVVMSTLYGQLIMGVLSLFIFPTNFCFLLRYIDHFAHVDKILKFSIANKEREQLVGRYIVRTLIGILITSAAVYAGIFLLEDRGKQKCYTDFTMIGILTLAAVIHTIPTALLLFFLNGINLRFKFFNEKMGKIVLPVTPSCFSCESYADYATELNGQVCQRKSTTLAEDLEKMRVLHEELAGLIDQTSNVFGSHIVRLYISYIIGLILNTYFVFVLSSIEFWFLYIYFIVYMAAVLLLVSHCAGKVTIESSGSLRVLNKVSLIQLHPDCSFQVQTFVRKLHNTRALTAAGYFTVNRNMVTAILGAITTYFLILFQFKFTDFTSELDKLAYCGN